MLLNLDKNDNNPLFLGEELGLQEYTNPRYPKLDELALLQRSQFWTETEISMDKDHQQWPELEKSTQDITILNLSWQTMTDSLLGRCPMTVLLPLVSNPELEGMFLQWAYFENLHSRAYSNIIQNVFPEPQEIINQIKVNAQAFKRLEIAIDTFQKLHDLAEQLKVVRNKAEHYQLEYELRKQICRTMIMIFALEAIQFYCSFACTFALAQQDILPGISKNLQLIAKDEALHTRMSLNVIKILRNDPEFAGAFLAVESEAEAMIDAVCNLEKDWGHYIFSEGRQILGLNGSLVAEYIEHIATNAKIAFGIKVEPTKNPIPWITKYLEPEKVQVAPQELEISNYRVGSTDNDLDLNDLGEFDF